MVAGVLYHFPSRASRPPCHPWCASLEASRGPFESRQRASCTPNCPHSPPRGCPKGGSEFKYRSRPNRLWGHPKGTLGAPGPRLSGPVLPWIRPERRKPLFWPFGLSVSLRHPTGRDPHRQIWPGFHQTYHQGSLEATGDQSRTGLLIGFIDTVRCPQECMQSRCVSASYKCMP